MGSCRKHQSQQDNNQNILPSSNSKFAKRKKARDKFGYQDKFNIHLVGKTTTQTKLLQAFEHNDFIIARGPAGTGKTYLATGYACKEFNNGFINHIVISRSNIPTGKSLGFFQEL